MGSWLNLFGKELLFIFLVLSYVFGNQYNKKYSKLMNSLGDTLYDFPHSLNVRGRQTRDAEISNKLLTEQGVNNKRFSNENSQTSNANNSCCNAACITRKKRGSSVNRLLFSTVKRFTNTRNRPRTKRAVTDYNIYDRTAGRAFRSVPTYDVLNRRVKSETDDILNSIGGDLKRIQTKIIQSANKVKEPSMSTDELIKNLKNMKIGDDELADSILLKENNHKSEKKEKISNSNILANAFHHLTKNHVLHTKREKAEHKLENEKNHEEDDEPALLSFFKDEGEPAISVVNQTEDEHGEFTEDPFQGTILKPVSSLNENHLNSDKFEEYEHSNIENRKANANKKTISVSPDTRSHITRSLNASIESKNLTKSTTNGDEAVALDPRTGTGISIKSIFSNAVEEAIERTEGSVAKDDTLHKDVAPLENVSVKESTVQSLDPIDKFLNESNDFVPDNSTDINPDSVNGERNITNYTTDDNVKIKGLGQDQLLDIDEIVANSLSKTIANSQKKNEEQNREGTTKNMTISKVNGNGNETEADHDYNNNNRSKTGIPKDIFDDDYIMSNDTKTVKNKEPIISPIGEDYIETDVITSKADIPIPRIKEPLGDEYVETTDYLPSKSIIPMDDASMEEKSLPDDEKVHAILKDKYALRSNYIHEHMDLNREILELIQSYYKTGGRKHLKDIYRDSKWNHANRNRIEFFNAVDKESIGAVCMDGSHPGYYLRKGFDSGADKWIIHLHGGAWCYNLQTCYKRRNTILGSTKGYSREDISKFFHGILSKNADENPYFFKWNIAVLSYCDGGLFSGNRKMFLMGKGKKFYFRGRRVLRLLMENLRRQQNLQKAKEVILSGTSAGGLALILQGDYIRKFIPKNIKVRGLADAAFFLDQKKNGVHGNRMAHKQFKALYELHRPVLKKKCVDSYPKKDRYLCLFPQNTIHFVKLPLFIVNSLYDHWQLSYLEGVNCIYDNGDCKTPQRDHILNFRNRMYSTLSDVKTFKNNTGIFANSCIAHGQVILDYTWARSKIDNTSIAEAFVKWYKSSEDADTENVNFHADCKYPCNGSCPRTLAQTCVQNFKAVSTTQRDKSLNLC